MPLDTVHPQAAAMLTRWQRCRDVFEGGVPSYYRDCVVGGDGSFLVTVTKLADFSDAIRHKMVLEVAGLEPVQDAGPPPIVPVQAAPLPGPVDCGIGVPIP